MKMKKSKVVSIFGGPGTGKTTTAMGLASLMKRAGMSCEYISEHAKDLVWEDNSWALSCQPLIAGEQIAKQHRVEGKVDFIITDSPIIINLLHDGFGVTDNYKNWLVEVFNMFDNINILLTVDRNKKKYETKGRTESKKRAIEMDKENNSMLLKYNIPFVVFDVNENTIENIFNYIRASYTSDGKKLRTKKQ